MMLNLLEKIQSNPCNALSGALHTNLKSVISFSGFFFILLQKIGLKVIIIGTTGTGILKY